MTKEQLEYLEQIRKIAKIMNFVIRRREEFPNIADFILKNIELIKEGEELK